MRFNNKPGRAVDPNIFRFGNALHSKPWLKCCLLRCMLSAGREVKMEIPICACHFNSNKDTLPVWANTAKRTWNQQPERQNRGGTTMKVVGRKFFGRAMVCAAIGFMTLAIFSHTKIVVAAQQAAG